MKTLITLALTLLFSLTSFCQTKVIGTVTYNFGTFVAVEMDSSGRWIVCQVDQTGAPDFEKVLKLKYGCDLFPLFDTWAYCSKREVQNLTNRSDADGLSCK